MPFVQLSHRTLSSKCVPLPCATFYGGVHPLYFIRFITYLRFSEHLHFCLIFSSLQHRCLEKWKTLFTVNSQLCVSQWAGCLLHGLCFQRHYLTWQFSSSVPDVKIHVCWSLCPYMTSMLSSVISFHGDVSEYMWCRIHILYLLIHSAWRRKSKHKAWD